MSRNSKNKIPTEHKNSFSVKNPFADVSLENLPEPTNLKSDTKLAIEKKNQSRGRIDVLREKSGRAGKTVTVLRGFSETISSKEIKAIALQLKKNCACGGSLKERAIELQGDVCQQVMHELEKLKFRPVRCGG